MLAIERAGYDHRPDATGERVPLAKGPRERRTQYASLVAHGGTEWPASLAFRDALRSDPSLRAAYAALKRELAAANADDRPTYTARKAAFAEDAIDDALDD